MSAAEEALAEFAAEAALAIEQLQILAGDDVARKLDFSPASIAVLETFVTRLRNADGWLNHLPPAARTDEDAFHWLASRVAHYLAAAWRQLGGSEWYLSADKSAPTFGTPVILLGSKEVSPIAVAHAWLLGQIDGGLVAAFQYGASQLQTN